MRAYLRIALVLANMTLAACAMPAPDELAPADDTAALTSAFVLTVTSGENVITVSSPGRNDTCPRFETRSFAYLSGTALTVTTFAVNTPDCARFLRWDGACAGQSNQCSLVITSDLSTASVYGTIPGCHPK